jgi:glutamate racemase
LALDVVQDEFDFPIVGVVKPGALAAVQSGRRIGVIATQATVKSQAYGQEMRRRAPTIDVWEVACPAFVPLIENDMIDSPEMMKVAREYLQPLIDQNIDTLVFGCTHYPHLRRVFEQILPAHVTYVNPAEATVREISRVLVQKELQSDNNWVGQTSFYVSGCTEDFANLSLNWLLQKPPVENISVEDLAL